MKKVVLIMFLILVGFTINSGFVYADNNGNNYSGSYKNNGDATNNTASGDCGVLGDPNNEDTIAYYLQQVFNIIRFAGPILVVLLTVYDLIKVVSESKQDEQLKKVGIKTLKRVIYAVLLFVLPTLITIVFNLVGLYGTCVS